MTTNASGKLNIGGVDAIKSIAGIPAHERTLHQTRRLNACLAALRKQPKRWLSYQDWGPGGPEKHLADRGIVFVHEPDTLEEAKRRYEDGGNSWYDESAPATGQ